MSATLAIEMNGIHAGYRREPVLADLAWRVEEGGCWSLMGPNGAGKTTMLRVLGGVLRPSGGSLTLCGRSSKDLSRTDWSRLTAFVPASLEVPVALTVGDLAAMGRLPHLSGWQRFSAEDRAAVRQALDLTGLTGFEDRYLDELSGGERQRASIALALAQQPRILLLDEPTAHLDIHHAWQLMETILRLKAARRMTVIFSSHDLNLSAEFASHAVLMKKGRMVAQGECKTALTEETLAKVYDYPLKIESAASSASRWIRPQRNS